MWYNVARFIGERAMRPAVGGIVMNALLQIHAPRRSSLAPPALAEKKRGNYAFAVIYIFSGEK